MTDYHAEGQKILGRFEDQPGPGSLYEDVSAIYNYPGGGTLFIGNIRAASDATILQRNGISCIVNCQDTSSENFFQHDPNYKYLRFPIAHWWSADGMNSASGVKRFYHPLFSFVENALKNKQNVMIHCLAGAHRAGTAGISCMMYLHGLQMIQAVRYVKERRPIVDPIGSFPDLLDKLQRALVEG